MAPFPFGRFLVAYKALVCFGRFWYVSQLPISLLLFPHCAERQR